MSYWIPLLYCNLSVSARPTKGSCDTDVFMCVCVRVNTIIQERLGRFRQTIAYNVRFSHLEGQFENGHRSTLL